MSLRVIFFSISFMFFFTTSLQATHISSTGDRVYPEFDRKMVDQVPTHIVQAYWSLERFGVPQDIRRHMMEIYFAAFIFEPYKQAKHSYGYAELLEYFIKEPIDPRNIVSQLKYLSTLYDADIIILLLRDCCRITELKIESIAREGRTLLHMAFDELAVAKILLKASDDPNKLVQMQDNEGRTVLFTVAFLADIEMGELLFSATSCSRDLLNKTDKQGLTALEAASKCPIPWESDFLKFARLIKHKFFPKPIGERPLGENQKS
jgi:hypothetical protein